MTLKYLKTPRPFAVTRFVAIARLFRDKTQFVAAVPICKVYIFCHGDEVVLLHVVVVVLVFFIDVDF